MSQAPVAVSPRHVTGAIVVLDIVGDLTGLAEAPLMDAYVAASSGGARAIILNFNDLGYMNSSGIGLLVTLLIRVQRNKQTLLAVGLTDHYQQIFELTRLNEAIVIYPDEARAVASI
ncbi:MAG: STAS domain-containing protein [Caldilineaceae bacterium]|nr:STAS domain-containing protein [Caldilineaceae bacterium]